MPTLHSERTAEKKTARPHGGLLHDLTFQQAGFQKSSHMELRMICFIAECPAHRADPARGTAPLPACGFLIGPEVIDAKIYLVTITVESVNRTGSQAGLRASYAG